MSLAGLLFKQLIQCLISGELVLPSAYIKSSKATALPPEPCHPYVFMNYIGISLLFSI